MALRDKYGHPDWPYICDEYCKVHWYWDLDYKMHVPYPGEWNINRQAGWIKMAVFVGPPAYYPRSPNPEQWENMRMECPHVPRQLLCNTCWRHWFRPVVL